MSDPTHMDTSEQEVGDLGQRDEVADMGWKGRKPILASAAWKEWGQENASNARRPVGAVPIGVSQQ